MKKNIFFLLMIMPKLFGMQIEGYADWIKKFNELNDSQKKAIQNIADCVSISVDSSNIQTYEHLYSKNMCPEAGLYIAAYKCMEGNIDEAKKLLSTILTDESIYSYACGDLIQKGEIKDQTKILDGNDIDGLMNIFINYFSKYRKNLNFQSSYNELYIKVIDDSIVNVTDEYIKKNIENLKMIIELKKDIIPCVQVILGIYYLKRGEILEAKKLLTVGCSDKNRGYHYALKFLDNSISNDQKLASYSDENAKEVFELLFKKYQAKASYFEDVKELNIGSAEKTENDVNKFSEFHQESLKK